MQSPNNKGCSRGEERAPWLPVVEQGQRRLSGGFQTNSSWSRWSLIRAISKTGSWPGFRHTLCAGQHSRRNRFYSPGVSGVQEQGSEASWREPRTTASFTSRDTPSINQISGIGLPMVRCSGTLPDMIREWPLTSSMPRLNSTEHCRKSGAYARLNVRCLAMRSLICVAIFALLAGCRRDEQAYVQRTVTSIGATTLLADAARLASSQPDEVGEPVDPKMLPASFRAFAPVETWRYGRSFFIVTARWFQHRVGVLVQPLDYPEPTNSPIATHTKLATGIYYCST